MFYFKILCLVKVRSYLSYIKSFWLVSALNPDCYIRMNCDNGPWIVMLLGLCFAENTSLTAIFARDILLYCSYRRFYVALAQKLFRYSSCHHGVGAATAYTLVCGAAAPQVSTSMSPPHTWRRYVRLVWLSSCHSLQNTITMVQRFFVTIFSSMI
jgi:hypothetical protein